MRLRSALLAAATAVTLAACDTTKQVEALLPQKEARLDEDLAQNRARQSSVQPLLTITDKPILSRALRQKPRMRDIPANLQGERGIWLQLDQPVTLRQLAAELTALTNISFKVDDAALPNAKGASLSNATTMVADYVGPLSGLLDIAETSYGVSFEVLPGEIRARRYLTRTWRLPPAGAKLDISAAVSDNASQQSGNRGGGTAGGGSSGGSGGAGSSGNSNNSQQGKLEFPVAYWDGLDKILGGLITDGQHVLSPTSGLVVVTATPAVMALVERYMDVERQSSLRQVSITAMVISYSADSSDDYGLDLAAVFTDAGLKVAFQGAPAIPSVAGAASYGIGFISPPPGNASSIARHWAGTTATLKALEKRGRVSIEVENQLIGLNNHGMTFTDLFAENYVEQVLSQLVSNVGATTGTVTATINSGLSLQIVPRVLDDGIVSMAIAYSNTGRPTLDLFTSGQGDNQTTVQLPKYSKQQTIQFPAIPSGSTMILTGFREDRAGLDRSGIAGVPMLGGSNSASKAKRRLAVLLTPVIFDPLDLVTGRDAQ